ncbi:MAG: phosphatase PAP2 family protein [Ilumatobacteraceae bacterium]|nr:phosphatase PAP2 family protein [Ilumatobacteraceae bacterium]
MSLQDSKAVESFDVWADAQLERLRGHKVADVVFTTASELGDFSLIWHFVGAVRGLTSDHHANQAFVFSALIGAESLIVNQGIKRLFRRTRPTETGDPRYPVRRPSTSSFPSGHASSAFFAASILTAWGGAVTAPAWFALAGVVGTSRAYVRIHHPSDVVGGAVVGLLLGQAALAALRAIS